MYILHIYMYNWCMFQQNFYHLHCGNGKKYPSPYYILIRLKNPACLVYAPH